MFSSAILVITMLRCADYNLLDNPPSAVILEITGTTDTSITVRWTQSPDADYMQYRIYYSATNDIVDTSDLLADTIRFRFDTVKTISGLQPNTAYYIRVFILNQNSAIMGSNIVQTTTLRDIKSIELFDPPDSIVDTTVYLRWSKSRDPLARRYVIYYDTTSNVDSSDVPRLKTIITNLNDTTAGINGLVAGEKYWFKLHVQNAQLHFIASSNALTVTLEQSVPVPVQLWVDSATDTTAYLRWNKSKETNFSAYEIYKSSDQSIDTTDSLVKTVTTPGDTIYKAQKLVPDSQCWFAIVVQKDKGLTSASNAVPNIAVVLSADKVTDSSVSLSWTPSYLPLAQFNLYKLFRDTFPITVPNNLALLELPKPEQKNVTNFVDSTVDSAITYHYRIFVYEVDSTGKTRYAGSNDLQVKAE